MESSDDGGVFLTDWFVFDMVLIGFVVVLYVVDVVFMLLFGFMVIVGVVVLFEGVFRCGKKLFVGAFSLSSSIFME